MQQERHPMATINLRPSRQLAFVLSLAHTAAAGACLLPDLPPAAGAALVVGLAASCVCAVRGRALLHAADSILALQLEEGGNLWVRTAGEGWSAATLHDSTFVNPWLTVLSVTTGTSRRARHAVILADSVSAEDFRKLRVWLRWRNTARGAAPARASQ
jgi:toxin CptA